MAKVCILNEKFSIEEIENTISIDTSVEDWIKEIEAKVKENKKRHKSKEKIKTRDNIKEKHVELKFMKEILKMKGFDEMRCSF